MTKPLCIYHGNCADGFTAAWAVWKRFGDAFDYHAGVYQNPAPDVTGRDVVLVDFSYKRAVLREMARRARSILVLDHHKTAADDLGASDGTGEEGPHVRRVDVCPPTWEQHMENVTADSGHGVPYCEIYAYFDMDRSGAGIAWDFFHSSDTRPAIVRYAEDRDLWRFLLPFSREISAYTFAHDYSFDVWESLARQLETRFDTCVDMGAAIEKKHHKDVAELVAALKRRMVIGGHEVWAASLPYTLTSDAGHLMATGEPFAACYWDTPEGRVFSLRSTDDGLDVSEIAKQYGGGGHRNASGFRLPHGATAKRTPNLDHPWRWLALQMIWPVCTIVLVCVVWAHRGTLVNILDVMGGALIVFAGWLATDRLRELSEAYAEALRSLNSQQEEKPRG